MKKYVKPELFFESYELSQNIAACGWDMNNADVMLCNAVADPDHGNDPSWGFGLVEGNDNCQVVVESYCYENGSDNIAMRIFQS